LSNETVVAVATTLAGYWIQGRTPRDLAEYVPGIDAVDAQAVEDVGRRYFASRKQTVVIQWQRAANSKAACTLWRGQGG